jgi:hypothetical protein
MEPVMDCDGFFAMYESEIAADCSANKRNKTST